MATVTLAGVEELQAQVRGDVITPDDARYDEARKVYNAMIDKHPALVVSCRDVADVQAALAFGRANGLDIAVRGARAQRRGSRHGGRRARDRPLADALGRASIRSARTAQVGGGCTMGDIDHATHAFGLATPVGIISTTGVGLLLGGGVGHLTRKYGLAIDNIVAADVVLADGSFVRASEDENADLFWAIRGGGGNFGVVTSLTLNLHPVSTVVAGPILWPLDQSAEVLAWYREFLPAQPDELTGFFAFLTVPPGPAVSGGAAHAEDVRRRLVHRRRPRRTPTRCSQPARKVGKPALDGVMELPLPAWNSAFDALYPPGDQWYWRGDYVKEIPDAAIDIHVEFGKKLPTWKSTMHLYPSDGAASRVAAGRDAVGLPRREVDGVFAGVDPDPANADAIRAWTVEYQEALHPYSMGGSYVNFMDGRGSGARGGDVRLELRAPRVDQGEVRPGERLPREPEHQACVASFERRGASAPRRSAQLEPGHPLRAEPVAVVAAHEDEQHALAAAAADHEARRVHEDPRLAERRDVAAVCALPARARSARARTPRATCPRRRFRPVLPRSPPRWPEALGLDALGWMAELDELRRDGLDERRRAADEDARLLLGREARLAEQVGVDATRAKAVALLARQRQDDVVAERLELAAVDHVVERSRRVDQPRGNVRRPRSEHRPQRHDARAAADEQQRPAFGRIPREPAADRPAHLERVAVLQLADEVRRDLAVLDQLDGQLEPSVVRARRDRVRALGLVAVLRREADVDVLSGAMAFPVVDVEDERARVRRLVDELGQRGDAPLQRR